MPKTGVKRIRDRIRLRQYDMSAHASDEMAEDFLDILDVEQAVLNGRIVQAQIDDPRGTKYVINGIAADGLTQVGVVGRFTDLDRLLIITVYLIPEAH